MLEVMIQNPLLVIITVDFAQTRWAFFGISNDGVLRSYAIWNYY